MFEPNNEVLTLEAGLVAGSRRLALLSELHGYALRTTSLDKDGKMVQEAVPKAASSKAGKGNNSGIDGLKTQIYSYSVSSSSFRTSRN